MLSGFRVEGRKTDAGACPTLRDLHTGKIRPPEKNASLSRAPERSGEQLREEGRYKTVA